MKAFLPLAALFALAGRLAAAPAEPSPEDLKFFEKEVRPLLAERCYECHGEKKKKGSLRLDNIAFIHEGGDSGPALVPGKPDDSLLIKGIRYTDPDFEMPPKKKLAPAEIAVLEKWVALGAPWPASEASKVALDENGFSAEAKAFWSFQPLAKVEPPAGAGAGWARNEIDRFIARKLTEQKLTPAPEASRAELVRRLYFDVHGLPPTRDQVQAFLSSTDPLAYEKLVDDLLASPRYGERWAQHWLDLVRYAESDGYNQDALRPSAWPYRDWVIRSLNADLPYDQFVRQQLAGDELDPANPNVVVATGYLRNGIYEYNERDVRGQWDLIVNDMTDNAGEVFLGLSYGCARCHDHKFDPILQKDYFRLKAFFAPVWWRDDRKLASPAELAAFQQKQAAWEEATAAIRTEMQAMTAKSLDGKVRKSYDRFTDDLRAMVDKPLAARTALERQLAGFCERQMEYERQRFVPTAGLKPEEKTRYQELEAQLKAFDSLKPAPLPDAFVATDAAAQAPPVTFKTRRGEQEVAPGFLTLLAPGDPAIPPGAETTHRRTALAAWITRPDNQLTTRVIVNRVWAYHFGRGLIGTPNDLGKLGEPPTHPELLDWLATRFVSQGWSLKQLHREILLSATYRQSAHRTPGEEIVRVDPADKFLWRFPPRRLDAEQVRDAMLLASGELDAKAGGPPSDGNGTRRSIYTVKKRNNQTELLRSLDAPAGFASTAERQSTTTPTQALLLMNGEWPLARARKLAARAPTIEDAWQYALGRPPSPEEAALARAFLQKHSAPPAAPRETTPLSSDPALAGVFKENTPQERLVSRATEEEGSEFTTEAIVRLESYDSKSSVRTIISRWNGAKDSTECYGWSLGVTGQKSKYKPGNLVLQVVGDDENDNLAHEVIASDLRLELGHRYHVSARLSCATHTARFLLRDLDTPGAAVQTAERTHSIRGKLETGTSGLAIGGLSKRLPQHGWDGRIEAARVVPGILSDEALSADPAQWKASLINWNIAQGPRDQFDYAGNDAPATKSAATPHDAMADLCHVLLNANEFFYLQ